MDELQLYGELLTGVDFKVVAIHPLADETELLAKLNMSTEHITKCDLYWVFRNRLFFVSITHIISAAPIVSYYRSLDIEHGHSFWVNTNVAPLTKAIVNKGLHYLAAWIENNEKALAETDKAASDFKNVPEEDEAPTETKPLIISDSDIFIENQI